MRISSFLIGLFLVPALLAGPSFSSQSPTSHAAHGTTPYSDRAFLSAMIVHHEDAVAMAKKTLQTKPKDPDVASWCQAVIDTQAPEIILMRKILEPMGGVDKEAAARELANAMQHSMSGSDGKTFVSSMLLHHKAALDMAAEALLRSENPDVILLAEAIITAQAREMREFKTWLRTHR